MRTVLVLLLAVSVSLGACSSKKDTKAMALDPFAGKGSPYYKGSGKIPMGGGRYHVGKPYQVAGRWFTPKEQPNYDKVGNASWYGEAFHRRRTSNGEYFDMHEFTAAHATLPLPSYVRVTNINNGRSIVVRVNDRGPFVGTRIIDVSKRTAEALDFKRKGTERVRVKYLGPAPIDDPGGRHLMALNKGRVAPADESMMVAENEAPPPVQRKKRRKLQQPVLASVYNDEGQEGATRSAGAIRMSYFVELGTFADPDNVERIRDGLAEAGPLQVTEIEGDNGPLYRLRLGPISDVNAASTAYNQAVGFGLPDARITEAPVQEAALR